MQKIPGPFLRVLFALPTHIYRIGLGRLFGHRFLMLTHRGRRSGRVYRTILEVARYDAARRECCALSGWGERANWYQNLRAGGALTVHVGGRSYVPDVRFLQPDEVYDEMQRYLERYGWFQPIARSLARRLLGLRFDGSDRDLPEVRCLRGIAVRPSHRAE